MHLLLENSPLCPSESDFLEHCSFPISIPLLIHVYKALNWNPLFIGGRGLWSGLFTLMRAVDCLEVVSRVINLDHSENNGWMEMHLFCLLHGNVYPNSAWGA